jgi:hypothetical protein
MPTTKLTLSADKELVRQAKELARERGTSLSAMFDRFIRSILLGNTNAESSGPLTSQALGLVRLPNDKTDNELLEEALTEKHGG